MHELEEALRDFDPKKSPGPDYIHGRMLSHLGPKGKQRLLDIYNMSWKCGRLPREWKKAFVIPISKPGKISSSPESYRPIALTCTSCKIMEKVILRRLSFYLESNDLLPNEQYGFKKGHCTIDQILFFCQSVRDAQNQKPTNHTVAAFLDLTKAFDKVWRNKLITKLFDVFGIGGRALPWISDFLKDRIIRVKFNMSLSKDYKLSQGVPQGSVLSPLLFSLYLAGIEKVISKRSRVGQFADDMVIWHSGADIKTIESIINLTIKDVIGFAEDHKLLFNVSKSVTSFFTTNRHLYNYKPIIFMQDQPLPYVKNAKYLGYTLDQEILSNRHIEALVERGRKRMNILKYISGRDWGADASTLRTTYTSLVRPILEYGFPVYFCASATNLFKLERVQLSAARIITGMRHSCPNELVLYESDLQPLSLRRNSYLVKYYNKLLSYGDQNRTSAYLRNWTNNQRLKRNSPFSQATSQGIVYSNVEQHSIKPSINPVMGLQRVSFHTELLTSVNKKSDPPELLRQIALETFDRIPRNALRMFTDGSKSDRDLAGSGVYIMTANTSVKIVKRNPDSCSVFRSELTAIKHGLSYIEHMVGGEFKDIWILTDSRASIQHLSNWKDLGDKTGTAILALLSRLTMKHQVHFQWVPSHVGVAGNEIADTLAKAASVDAVQVDNVLTYNEVFSKNMIAVTKSWKSPPAHPWYFRKSPGGAMAFKGDRQSQTAFSRFASGHLQSLSFENGQKVFPTCKKCSIESLSPQHLLACLDFSLEDVLSNVPLFIDFLRTFGLMELV